ncbi:hypothetical protein JYU34_014317 [Plutella xylostella]|uniref:Uncharacterized protein n=1 Tax=Plutella xylostella TaxID=51655 RepID=A0ABQ7Q819_PLUXY|nr:hypothetical protein JYU34_014317 [Plutella xylostella]
MYSVVLAIFMYPVLLNVLSVTHIMWMFYVSLRGCRPGTPTCNKVPETSAQKYFKPEDESTALTKLHSQRKELRNRSLRGFLIIIYLVVLVRVYFCCARGVTSAHNRGQLSTDN